MKVAIHSQRFHPSLGGMETHISNLVSSSENCEFVILTNAIQGHSRTESWGDHATVKRFGPDDRNFTPFGNRTIHRMSFPLRHRMDNTRQRNVQKWLDSANYDIFHAHHPSLPHTIVKRARWMNRPIPVRNTIFKTDRPKLVTIHGLLHTMNPDKLYSDYEGKLINSYNNIICVDKFIEDYARSIPGSDRKDIRLIPNSVDTNIFKPEPIQTTDKLKVGFVGRLERSRGTQQLDYLISKLPGFAELHVVGAASQPTIDEFRRRNRSARILFHQNIPNERLPEFFGSIDVLFNPVQSEGISRITLESMACGRPVIMIDRGDRHPVVPGRTGFLVKQDMSDLVQTLHAAGDDPDALRGMSITVRECIEKEFSNDIVIPKIEAFYRTVLEAHN